jgi:hypothetical protein
MISGGEQVNVTCDSPYPGASPIGLHYVAQVGRWTVNFFYFQIDGEQRAVAVWNPEKPKKKLKPATLKAYRRGRREFAVAVAREFGVNGPIIDRMDGAPKVTELVMAPDGRVETLNPAVSYIH